MLLVSLSLFVHEHFAYIPYSVSFALCAVGWLNAGSEPPSPDLQQSFVSAGMLDITAQSGFSPAATAAGTTTLNDRKARLERKKAKDYIEGCRRDLAAKKAVSAAAEAALKGTAGKQREQLLARYYEAMNEEAKAERHVDRLADLYEQLQQEEVRLDLCVWSIQLTTRVCLVFVCSNSMRRRDNRPRQFDRNAFLQLSGRGSGAPRRTKVLRRSRRRGTSMRLCAPTSRHRKARLTTTRLSDPFPHCCTCFGFARSCKSAGSPARDDGLSKCGACNQDTAAGVGIAAAHGRIGTAAVDGRAGSSGGRGKNRARVRVRSALLFLQSLCSCCWLWCCWLDASGACYS